MREREKIERKFLQKLRENIKTIHDVNEETVKKITIKRRNVKLLPFLLDEERLKVYAGNVKLLFNPKSIGKKYIGKNGESKIFLGYFLLVDMRTYQFCLYQVSILLKERETIGDFELTMVNCGQAK